jgi:hypothetical protein
MADYYSLLARAVANLPKTSPPSTRRAIYDRARKALTNQLRSLKPQLPESDIAREERALDEAVARLEAEFEPAMADVHTLPLGAAAEYDESPPPAAPPPPPPPPPPRGPEAPVLRTPIRPAAPGAALKPPAPRPAPAPPAAARATTPAGGLPNAMPFKGPLLGGAEPAAPAEEAPQPSLGPVARDLYDEDAPAPSLGVAEREAREPARPMLNDLTRRKTPTWLWVGGAVALGFAGSVAVLALLMRPALQDLSAPPPVDAPVAAAPAGQEKTARRVGQAAPETPDAAASAEPSAPASPQPSDSPTPDASPAPTAAPIPTVAPSPTPSVASPSIASNSSIPIASRAAMLVATVADAAKPQIAVGTAVWTIVPAPPGQPAAVGVKSEIDIPDLKMHASMILRKNFDASLPASHTIDLRVTFDAGSPIKGIKDIALPLMRRDDPPAADALTGVRVKISDNYFLVGLNRGDSDIARNVQEIAERTWFDFPMQLDDDRIAKLTFEKGGDGEKVVAQALAAWK